MIGLVITGHGLFAAGMQSSAKMIAGENELTKYVCFEEGMNTEQLSEKLIAAYNELGDCDGIIVLSDLPGGSPFRTAVESAMTLPEKQIIVLSGTNLPMITARVMQVQRTTSQLIIRCRPRPLQLPRARSSGNGPRCPCPRTAAPQP